MFVERASELERLAQNYSFDVAAVEHLSKRYIVQMVGAYLLRAIVESAKSIIIQCKQIEAEEIGCWGTSYNIVIGT